MYRARHELTRLCSCALEWPGRRRAQIARSAHAAGQEEVSLLLCLLAGAYVSRSVSTNPRDYLLILSIGCCSRVQPGEPQPTAVDSDSDSHSLVEAHDVGAPAAVGSASSSIILDPVTETSSLADSTEVAAPEMGRPLAQLETTPPPPAPTHNLAGYTPGTTSGPSTPNPVPTREGRETQKIRQGVAALEWEDGEARHVRQSRESRMVDADAPESSVPIAPVKAAAGAQGSNIASPEGKRELPEVAVPEDVVLETVPQILSGPAAAVQGSEDATLAPVKVAGSSSPEASVSLPIAPETNLATSGAPTPLPAIKKVSRSDCPF